ncbi:lysozyme c-1-like [Fopius arisanus]|uniref:lysozyme n=1 Tax=Fopius arisanus TaxID=64838 RepID=A0A0C9PZN7_9HYME|nr:PREDICTED: lysozyme c-1-like [Fopius arisanus]
MMVPRFFVEFVIIFSIFWWPTHGRILTNCEAAKELQKAGIPKTFISNWVCLMRSESGMNTSLMKGPGTSSSFTYGIFQISSLNNKYCIRGRKGGVCNKKCEDFLNDDISDDIICASKIEKAEGFKYWKGWLNKCKSKPLPDVANCKRRRRRDTINSDIIL